MGFYQLIKRPELQRPGGAACHTSWILPFLTYLHAGIALVDDLEIRYIEGIFVGTGIHTVLTTDAELVVVLDGTIEGIYVHGPYRTDRHTSWI